MSYAQRSPNLLAVDPATGGVARMVGWIDGSAAVIPDDGNGFAYAGTTSATLTPTNYPVTAGSTYTFAVSMDQTDELDGGQAADSGTDSFDGGTAATAGVDTPVTGGSPTTGDGKLSAYNLIFRNASNTIIAATVTNIGMLAGDRAAWRATAPATAVTVQVSMQAATSTVRLSHPVLVLGSVDPGPLDPIYTPDGSTAGILFSFGLTATARKSTSAIGSVTLGIDSGGFTGDANDGAAQADFDLDLSLDATAVASSTKVAALGLGFEFSVSAVKGPPQATPSAGGDLFLKTSLASTGRKNATGGAALNLGLSITAYAVATREAAGEAYDWQLVAYTPGSATPTILPQPMSWQASFVLSDVGSLAIDYPVGGVNVSALEGYCDVEVQYRDGDTWVTPPNGRFSLMDQDKNFVTERSGAVRRYTFVSYGWLLAFVLQERTTGLDASGNRAFGSVALATIAKTLINEGKAKGSIPNLFFANEAANTKLTTIAYPVGKDLLSILNENRDEGRCEWQIERNSTGTEARTLTVYNTIGSDRSVVANPVRLVEGRDVIDAPSKISNRDMAARAVVQGDDGAFLAIVNAGADIPYGVLPTFVSAGGLSTLAGLQITAQARLDRGAKPRAQLTRQLRFGPDTAWAPFRDYAVGDKVLAQDATGEFAPLRVKQITLTWDGQLGGNVVLNDRFVERDERNAKRIKQLSGGASSSGGGGRAPIPVGDDKRIIKAPTSLVIGTTPYLAAGSPRALINAAWVNPQSATDDTPMDPQTIELFGRRNIAGTKFQLITSVDFPDTEASADGFIGGQAWQFKVRAIGTNNKRGSFGPVTTVNLANDDTPPKKPSAPVLTTRLGTITAFWDGKDIDGDPMPADFAFTEVHVSTVSGFAANASSLRNTLTGSGSHVATGMAYGEARYFRFVSVDNSGNRSTPSAQASASTASLVDEDVITNTINGAKIKDGTLLAADKIIGKSITGALIKALTIEAGHLKANLITADKIDAGAVTGEKLSAKAIDGKTITGATVRTSAGQNRVEMTDTGIRQYRANTSVSNWTADGFAFRSRLSGARIEMTSTGLRLYNGAGQATVNLQSNGDASFKGTITASVITGSTITGGTLRTSTSSTRLEFTSAGLKQYKAGVVLTELTQSGGFVFRSAASGPRITLSPSTGLKAYRADGVNTFSLGADGTAVFRGTVTASKFIDGTIDGTVATGVTVKSSSGSGNNWSGGTVAGASVSGGSVSGTSVSGSSISSSPYWAGSSGAGLGLGVESADGATSSRSLIVKVDGIRAGFLIGTNYGGGNGVRLAVGHSANSRTQYYSTGVAQMDASNQITLSSPAVKYTGTLSKTSLRATKTKKRDISDADVLALLDCQPVTYVLRDRGRTGTRERMASLIAEQVEAKAVQGRGLHVLLARTADRELTGINYSELSVFNHATNRYQQREIDSLTAQLGSALDRITTLEAAR